LLGIAAIPLAYLLPKVFFSEGLINGLVDVPVVIPHSAAGIAILWCGKQGTWLGRRVRPQGLHCWGVAGMSLPGIRQPALFDHAARDVLMTSPRNWRNLPQPGASPWRVFFSNNIAPGQTIGDQRIDI
jgi:molybdate/tungstate transport system permease protein